MPTIVERTPRGRAPTKRDHGQEGWGGIVDPVVIESLATVIQAIEGIGRKTFGHHRGLTVIFEAQWGYSWYIHGTNEIHISPGSQNLKNLADKRFGGINNFAMLAHEIAHYISGRDDSSIQKKYDQFVIEPCLVSGYSRTNRREEFAEIFASYLTNPELLIGRGYACEVAVRFMGELFAEQASNRMSCDSRRNSLRSR
jgi:hypothetical protein